MLPNRLLRYTVLSCGLVLLTATVASAVRWLPAAKSVGATSQTIGPLAAAAFATVLEAALLIGSPLGFGLALQRLVAESGGRLGDSLSSRGRFPSALLWSGLLWGAIVFGLSSLVNVKLAAPGRVANGLVAAAESACRSSPERASVTIPLVGARWICHGANGPRIEGGFSRIVGGTTYRASSMRISEDITQFEFTQFSLALPRVKGRLEIRVSAERAQVRGAFPLARPIRLGEFGRAALIAVAAVLLSVLTSWLVWSRYSRRYQAIFVSALVAASTFGTLHFLDGNPKSAASEYLAVLMVAGLVAAALRYIPTGFSTGRFRARILGRSLDV